MYNDQINTLINCFTNKKIERKNKTKKLYHIIIMMALPTTPLPLPEHATRSNSHLHETTATIIQ